MEQYDYEMQLLYDIKGAIFDTYNKLGPGLLEKAYKSVLCYYLRKRGLKCQSEVLVPILIDDINMDVHFRIDILVEDCVVIELKAVEQVSQYHHRQILNYMRLGNYHRGFLVNFDTDNIMKSIYPKINAKAPAPERKNH